MSIEVRPLADSELDAFFDQLALIFSGNPINPDALPRNRAQTELDRTLGAFDGERLVGTAGAFTFQMTVPGGVEVPAAGVTQVSVLPTNRRRGVLRDMMRRQLDDIHARGEPLAGLYASQAPIYERFGYGVGAWHSHLVIPRGRSAFRTPARDGRVRVVDGDTALIEIPPLHDRLRREQPGAVSRSRAYWETRIADLPDFRRGRSQNWYVLHDGDDGPDGFAIYRVLARWVGEDPGGTLFLSDLMASTPAATAALWRFCLDVDLMVRVDAFDRPANDPVRHLLADTRAARETVYDGLWLRLIDVGAAVAGRRYARDGNLAIEVRDEFCPWNAGRWELAAENGGGQCRRTERSPDLALDVADLGAAYLGGNRFTTLAAAGRVEAASPAALQRADAMFAASPAPWCPTHF
jgi:predicted acetyltransferase